MATNPIDRNAKSLSRTRRNFQRLANGGNQVVNAPLVSSGGVLSLQLETNSGLQVYPDHGLGVFLEPTGGLDFAADGGVECHGFQELTTNPASPLMGFCWFNSTMGVNFQQLAIGGTQRAMGAIPAVIEFASGNQAQTPGATLTPFTGNYQYVFPAGFLNILGRVVRVRFYTNLAISGPSTTFFYRPTLTVGAAFNAATAIPFFAYGIGTAPQPPSGDKVFDFDFITTTTGSSGEITAVSSVQDNSQAFTVAGAVLTGNATPIDLTQTITFNWTVQGTNTNTYVATAIFQRIELVK